MEKETERPENSGGIPHFPIGMLVGIKNVPGLVGKIAGAVSTVFFPGGIYPIEHADINGDPVVTWWHAADIVPQTVN